MLIIACGALAREVRAVSGQLPAFDLRCVPATLHNRPQEIVPAIETILDETSGRYDRTVLAFGDCGTGGGLDRLCEARRVDRLPGAHCYAFFAGLPDFDAMMEEELGTFFLTNHSHYYYQQPHSQIHWYLKTYSSFQLQHCDSLWYYY
ncbi:MAG: DUF1638 domain-containing protein, partial [Pseudomonadota bacterium]